MKTYSIGTSFSKRGKANKGKIWVITDVLTTYSLSSGEVHSVRYVATTDFIGQVLVDNNVARATVAMGLIRENV